MATIHERLGPVSYKKVVCSFWMEGKCNRNPCKFLHGEAPTPTVYPRTLKQQYYALPESRLRKSPYHADFKVTKRSLSQRTEEQTRNRVRYTCKTTNEGKIMKKSLTDAAGNLLMNRPKPRNGSASIRRGCESDEKPSHGCMKMADLKRIRVQKNPVASAMDDDLPKDKIVQKGQKACELWMSGNCGKGDQCQFLHSWHHGDGFSLLARLNGHSQTVSGIALPSGSDSLYSGSSDGTVQVWNCHTGHSAKVVNLGDKIGSLISEGPWLFVGMPNVVKAWNLETAADLNLTGPMGQVCAMAVASNMLFAGVQDGVILVWKASAEESSPFQLATSLKGHTSGVKSLAVGAMKLYSGSMDGKIMVWDLESLQCIQALDGHSNCVMSLVCSDRYLISCSLDHTIKVWFPSEGGQLEIIYAHNMEHGVIALSGVNDAEGKPILLCSCDDKCVQLYELPSFKDRGRIFSKEAASEIQMGPDGLFFMGDGSGLLTVWKFSKQSGDSAACIMQ